MPTTEQPKWAPRRQPRYRGWVFRYVPHHASERDPGHAALDGTHAQREGGRWNPPRSFPVLYTSCTQEVAIANLQRRHRGAPFQPWELDEADQPDLYSLDMDQAGLVDVVSEAGLAGIGLPSRYPDDVGHETTQPIGARLHAENYPGVWCLSAADRKGEEIALFVDEHHAATPTIAGPLRRLWEWFPVPDDWKPLTE